MDKAIILGSDHAGFELKSRLKDYLNEKDWTVIDVGTNSAESTDYPDYAHALAHKVGSGEGLGILICGSANGVSMTANKHDNVRAAIAWNAEVARLGKEHNDANVLSLPARYISEEEAIEIMESFLQAEFEGGRHQRRVNKINKL